MQIFFVGGPRAGTEMGIPIPPDAIEFPVYGINGSMNQTMRYERIKKTNKYEYIGNKKLEGGIEEGVQKSVARKITPHKQIRSGTGKMVYNEKKGRFEVKPVTKKE